MAETITAETTCHIDVLSHGRKITAKKDERLLETLAAHDILLRADCGGKGVCGKCRVELVEGTGTITEAAACTLRVTGDMGVRIPPASLLSATIVEKPPAALPASFALPGDQAPAGTGLGVAVDLGTTTIAVCLCNTRRRQVLSTVAVKNPQALYGDDVMSRIGWIGPSANRLRRLQQMVVRGIEWGIKELFAHSGADPAELIRMSVVGNPAMIHIFLGVNPAPLGISPYRPAFSEARRTTASSLGFDLPDVPVHTLNQISGFIGGDILAATLATELDNEPVGTLLIDLGTNGELVLKGRNTFFAASCATGPVFEGAALSCGMQALPGAIDRVVLDRPDGVPDCRVIRQNEDVAPAGLCGSGVISAVAALIRTGLVDTSGLLKTSPSARLQYPSASGRKYVLVPAGESATGRDISISQKDIRAVQLGKAALITGIEFLLRAAGLTRPEKILIAGAFGSNLDAGDMLTLGMLPFVEPERIRVTGNAAGAGAIMVLCDEEYLAQTRNLAAEISVIELAADADFQKAFVQRLSFPDPALQA